MMSIRRKGKAHGQDWVHVRKESAHSSKDQLKFWSTACEFAGNRGNLVGIEDVKGLLVCPRWGMLWNREREACQTGLSRRCLRNVHNVDNQLQRVYSIRRGRRSAEFWQRQGRLFPHTSRQHLRRAIDSPLVFSKFSYASGCCATVICLQFGVGLENSLGSVEKLPRGSADCSLLRVTSVISFLN